MHCGDTALERDMERIRRALDAACRCVSAYTSGRIESVKKAGGDPVTEADIALDEILKKSLLEPEEGWLSEETVDHPERLTRRRVWIVDPIDGTREFIEGIPEWCISVALAVDGVPVAGGVCNPAAGQLFLGGLGRGVTLNGKPATLSAKEDLSGARILASRSEIRRGLWQRFENAPFAVVPSGSIAYKLSCVAAGLAEATMTLVPKNEWDIAAGVCLVRAAGGLAVDLDDRPRCFNQPAPLLNGLLAGPRKTVHLLQKMIDPQNSPH